MRGFFACIIAISYLFASWFWQWGRAKRKLAGGGKGCIGIAIDPFVGRGSKLNKAIIEILIIKQPLTTRQIGKAVKNIAEFKDTSQSAVNKRVRNLAENQFLNGTHVVKKVGGPTNYYELTMKAMFRRMLYSNSPKDTWNKLTDEEELTIFAILVNAKNRT
jgi:predicted transcriptional regulator